MTLGDGPVLVTGGAGFVGSHLCERLLAADARVHVLDTLAVGSREHVPRAATLHEVDLRDASSVQETLAAVDPTVVFHLAAHHYIPYCNAHPEEAFDVNVMGTRHLLDACESLAGLDRVVYASTAAVYPPRQHAHAVTDPVGPTDVYGRTKLVGEDLLERFHTRTDVPTAAARLFNIYGSNETNPHLIPAIVDQLTADATVDGTYEIELGNLAPARDFVHVGDVVEALVRLTAAGDGCRRYNVGTGTAHTVREVVDAVATATDTDIAIVQDADRVRESDRPYLCADPSRIERELGWQAETPLVDGLRRLDAAEEIAV